MYKIYIAEESNFKAFYNAVKPVTEWLHENGITSWRLGTVTVSRHPVFVNSNSIYTYIEIDNECHATAIKLKFGIE